MLGRAGRTALKLIIAVVLAMTILGFAMIPSQTAMLFPTDAVPPAGPLPAGAERLEVEAASGERLHGVHFPPATGSGEPRMLILGFGGNAWNGQQVAEYLHQLYPAAHVVAFYYRGYRPSTGSPSADALLEDAPVIHDYAVQRIKPQHVIGVGFSIGGGVAAGLSRQRELDGLILVTPFDSLRQVAADLFPWFPVGPFFQHELATVEFLKRSDVPVAIVAAERDEIVAPERTAALRRQVSNLVYDQTIARAGHNDVYDRDEFQTAMQTALNAMVSAKK